MPSEEDFVSSASRIGTDQFASLRVGGGLGLDFRIWGRPVSFQDVVYQSPRSKAEEFTRTPTSLVGPELQFLLPRDQETAEMD